MGRIITVLLVGLAPIIVLLVRECAPARTSMAPAVPPAEIAIPAPPVVEPPAVEPPAVEPPAADAEPALPEDVPESAETEAPADAGDEEMK